MVQASGWHGDTASGVAMKDGRAASVRSTRRPRPTA